MSEPSAPGAGDLPDAVRTRVLQMVADVLPEVTPLPASLRKVAAFAPLRRAKLGAAAITTALEDDDFRHRAAVQARARAPREETEPAPGDEDPLATAARLWLLRPDGWESRFTELVAGLGGEGTSPKDASAREVSRLRARVESLEQAARDARAEHRERVQELREENARLRRKLGESRGTVRGLREELDAAAATKDEVLARAEVAASRAEAELRRLRAQVEKQGAELRAVRREERSDREEGTMKARLLLDTLLDAATGLRRELALPPVTGAPADAVDVRAAAEGARDPSAAGALGPDSPALLEQLLGLPRARLVVDGYNVSKTAWPSSPLEAQRTRLLAGLAPLVARTGAETTVVFDAHTATRRPVVAAPKGVKVAFSPPGVIADDVIRDYVAAEPEGRVVVAVTSDQALASDLRKAGARVLSADALVALLAR